MTFRNILVPLDGSDFAEAALPAAIQLARSAHAHLHLVLAHEPVAATVALGEAFPPPDFSEDARERGRRYLETARSELVRRGVTWVETHEIDGAPGTAIAESATLLQADLVVMATHGRGALGRFWLGGVADYLIRHLTIPVLVVHPDDQGVLLANPLFSILVALDLSEDAESILGPAIALAQLRGGHLTLVHVVEPIPPISGPGQIVPAPPDPEATQARRNAVQRRLDQIADRLRLRGLGVATRVVADARAASGLLQILEEGRFDLLAMTTHGRTGLRRLLLGSVAGQVLRGAAKPVLVLRPPPLIA